MHLKLDPRTRVADLTVAKQQMVEIAKALSFNSEVLIMDEPTAALTDAEIDELFRIIRQLRDKGVGVVYISHRLEELKQISDRITVMRDGRYVDTVATSDVTIDQIISMMVGRTIYETAPEVPGEPQPGGGAGGEEPQPRRARIQDVSFNLQRGEILGLRRADGRRAHRGGARHLRRRPLSTRARSACEGKQVAHPAAPATRCAHGIGYLSEDRKRYGLALGMDVETNIVLASLRRFLGWLGWVQDGRDPRQRRAVRRRAARSRRPRLKQLVQNLSGGNQQKVVIGKWLTADTDILIFDEPTRGIDVGAKSEIYKLLNELAQQGKAIIMISSELPEILRMSHRIVVMCEGRITGELHGREATQEQIMTLRHPAPDGRPPHRGAARLRPDRGEP